MANYKLFDILDHSQGIAIDGIPTYDFEREQSPVPGEGVEYSIGLVDPARRDTSVEICRFSDQIVTEVDGLFTATDTSGTKHDMATLLIEARIPVDCTPCQTEQ